MTNKKRAVVIFNLGGPDKPEAIQPFLFNLFYDRAIIDYPNPLRWLIAKIISARRAPVARGIYAKIGGASPILAETKLQAQALEDRLNTLDSVCLHRVFISMRYWQPFAEEAGLQVSNFDPDEIVLLPLYPQYSTTTTKTGFAAWEKAIGAYYKDISTTRIQSYPDQPGWVKAQAKLIRQTIDLSQQTHGDGPLRLLFSAHGLPVKIVAKGDPYPDQVKQGVDAILMAMGDHAVDMQICYQSRVGRLQWISPPLDEALEQAAADGVGVVIVPISFVSEHSETLVELDMDYREMAADLGVASYHRVPTVGTDPDFIDGLAELVLSSKGMSGKNDG